MKIRQFFILLLIISVCQYVAGQEDVYSFRYIGLEDGLSQSSINAIAQDTKGFMWFGTQDGLNFYDGYGFRVLKNEPFDPTSLSHNHISTLTIDHKGVLWVGTRGGGLNIYNPISQSFRRLMNSPDDLQSLSNNYITCVAVDSNQNIWIGTTNGLNKGVFNGDDPLRGEITFERYFFNQESSEMNAESHISSLHVGANGVLWVGTRNGLFAMDDRHELRYVLEIAGPQNTWSKMEKTGIAAIGSDRTGRVFVSTSARNFVIKENSYEVEEYSFGNKQLKITGINNYLTARNGDFWITTMGYGIYKMKFDESAGQYQAAQEVEFSYLPNSNHKAQWITSILEDRLQPGSFWVGSFLRGVVRIQRKMRLFHSNQRLPEEYQTYIRSTRAGPSGNIWLGLEYGLLVHDEEANQSRYFTSEKPLKGMKSHIIYSSLEDDYQHLWFGTYGGIYKVISSDVNHPVFRFYPLPSECYSHGVFSMFQDTDGTFILGTFKGIVKFDPCSGTYSGCPVMLDSIAANTRYYVNGMIRDHENRLWITTSNGLIILHNSEEVFAGTARPELSHYLHDPMDISSLRSKNLTNIVQDKNGTVWLGSMNGLIKVHESENGLSFEALTEKHGLANNVIYAVLYDSVTHTLWMSTNRGISRMNPATHKVDNFGVRDGLQHFEFNQGAFSRSSDGQMIFGGLNGYTRFYPWEIRTDPSPPVIWLTRFSGGDGMNRDLLNHEIEQINLTYTQNTFTVGFTGLNYKSPLQNTYAYRLLSEENPDTSWIYAGTACQANITNLPPGEYIFQVRAANSDGVWSATNAELDITIQPPFWKTIWFYLIVITLVGGLLLAFHQYRLRTKLQRMAELERVRKNTAADFHDELGHKLTIISLFGEILKQQANGVSEKMLPHLNKIISTSNSLYYSMKDLLWVLDPQKDSVLDLAILLKDFGDELFDKTGIAFTTRGISDHMSDLLLPMDQKRHIVLIFKEVMNNALKHSDASRTMLSVSLEHQKLQLTFTDNGKGFDVKKASDGHGLMNLKNRAEQIDSQLEMYSDSNGTTVKLVMFADTRNPRLSILKK